MTSEAKVRRSNTVEDFWSKVFKADASICWLWTGKKDKDGYGKFRWKNKYMRAHRVSWLIAFRQTRNPSVVMHTCDTPWCVNPNHLTSGTQQSNQRDKTKKDRQAKGEQVGTSKLKKAQVIQIRKLRAITDLSMKTIGSLFKVDASTVNLILKGRRWQHTL